MLTLFLVFAGINTIHAQTEKVSRVTFYVLWYDVGKAALEGLKGIIKVENGFKGFREINKIYYDPTLITIGEMEEALKRAKTYGGTLRLETKN